MRERLVAFACQGESSGEGDDHRGADGRSDAPARPGGPPLNGNAKRLIRSTVDFARLGDAGIASRDPRRAILKVVVRASRALRLPVRALVHRGGLHRPGHRGAVQERRRGRGPRGAGSRGRRRDDDRRIEAEEQPGSEHRGELPVEAPRGVRRQPGHPPGDVRRRHRVRVREVGVLSRRLAGAEPGFGPLTRPRLSGEGGRRSAGARPTC